MKTSCLVLLLPLALGLDNDGPCSNLVLLSSLKELREVDFSLPQIIMDHPLKRLPNSHPCLKAVVFPTNPNTKHSFMKKFQTMSAKDKTVSIRAGSNLSSLTWSQNIHRNFKLIHEPTQTEMAPWPIQGSHLKLVIFVMWPYLYPTPNGYKGVDRKMMDTLGSSFDFTYELREVTSSIDGKILNNGTLIGYIPDVSESRADLGINQLSIGHGRFQSVDFGPILAEHDFCLVGPTPQPRDPFGALILPFDTLTWLGLLSTIALIFGVIAWYKLKGVDKNANVALYEAWNLASLPLLQESLPFSTFQHFDNHVMILLVGGWLLTSLIFSMSYRSNLLANMMTQVPSEAIDTPEEVLTSGMPVFMTLQTMGETAVKESPIQIHRQVFEHNILKLKGGVQLGELPLDLDQRVARGEAFRVGTRMAMALNPDVKSFPTSVLISPTSWTAPKASRLLQELRGPILHMQEAGLIAKWYNDEMFSQMATEQRFRQGKKTKHNKIGFSHVAPILTLHIILLFGALIVFIVEIRCSRIKRKQNVT